MRGLSKEDKRSLTTKTNMNAIVRLVLLSFFLSLLSAAILHRVTWWPVLLLPQGLLLVSLFHLEHECIHDTPFRTNHLNSITGAACGFILLLPSLWFRYFHRDHHRYTQIKGKDPELESSKPATKRQWLIHLSGLPVFLSLVKVIIRCTTGSVNDSFIPAGARHAVIRQARYMSAGYLLLIAGSLASGSAVLLWIWVIPLMIGQPFLRLYLLAEHTLCDNTDNMFLNTRTVLSNPLVRWFTWNMPYHTEHHVYPAVPFHQLPSLHRKMIRFLAHTNRSYSEFNTQLYKTLE